MQYHYVVFYDTEKDKWFTEIDTCAYFPDGNVWSDELADETGFGFFFPEDDSNEALLDQTLCNTLYALQDIIPTPSDVVYAARRRRRTRAPISSVHSNMKDNEVSGQLNFWEAE